MIRTRWAGRRYAWIVVLVIGYAILAHYTNSNASAKPLGAVQGPLPATVVRYTRRATAAWAVFFALIAAVSLALYQSAPLRVWSAFSNFFTLPLVTLMFIGEYAVRRRVLPPQHRTGLLASVRVYLDSSRRTTIVRQ